MLNAEHLRVIEDAVNQASSEHDLRSRVQAQDDDAQSLGPAVLAFGFHFIPADATETRERRGGPWGPMVELDGTQFPPPLESIEQDVLAAWQQMLDGIDKPAIQARCGDLLWVRKYGDRPDKAARAAIRGYLDLAKDDDWREMELTEGLARSLEIARELRDDDLAAEVARTLSAAADREMSREDLRPGITLRLLQPLVTLPRELRPGGLRDQLIAAEARYGSDPYIAQAIGESLAQLDPDQREDINRNTVRRWIDEASRGDALLRVMRLQQALELALSSGLKEEGDEIRRLLAGIEEKDLDLAAVQAEVAIPREPISTFAEQLRALELAEALRVFGAQGPPTGNPTEAEQAASEALRDSPLLSLIPRVVLGEVYPSPVFKADTPERRQRLEVAEYRARQARIWSVMAAGILDATFSERRPSKDELEAALESPLLAGELSERVAAAFELFLDGLNDECVHVLTPRIEAALRTTAAATGLPVTVPPRGEEPGGVVTLGAILTGLDGRLDEGWRLYLTTVLTDPLALNLRNAVAHGLRGSFGRTDAALLLHVVCLIAGWDVDRPAPAST